MSKTILLIENDAPFAAETSGALEAVGFQVRVSSDGKDGLDLARELKPDAIVLCVELPRLSGYSICNKIKKDDSLKGIPLVLTSSEATDEVFEDHRKLKVRAEEYLIKPYLPTALVEKLVVLVGRPEGSEAPEQAFELASDELVGDEEVVSLEEELGLETFAAEPGEELPALDLDSLPDEPAASSPGALDLDDDLKLLDDAFDGLSTPSTTVAEPEPRVEPATDPLDSVELAAEAEATGEAIEKALGVDRPVTSEDLEAASASLPDEDEAAARAELGGVADEADLALGALTETRETETSTSSAFDAFDAFDGLEEPSPPPTEPFASPGLAASGGASALTGAAAGTAAGVVIAAGAVAAFEAVTASPDAAPAASLAELARLETELAERRAALNAREADVQELKRKLEASVRRAEEAETALGEQEAEAASSKARADTLAAQARKADAEAKAAREESRRAIEQAREAGIRAEAAEARVGVVETKAAAAESRATAAEGRSQAAEQDAAGQRRAAEQSAGSLSARIAELAAKATELAAARADLARLAPFEREVERLETELLVARGEVEGARAEVEKRSIELKRRISELEAANAKNEERVVKAYLKIKGDEKVRDKARKALAIALQLLEEGLPAEAPVEKRPAATAAPLRTVPE